MSIERSQPARQWAATRPGDDLAQLAQKVAAAHRSFVESADAAGVRAVVRDSWLRSDRGGVSPDSLAEQSVLSGVDLDRYRSAHPMALIRPVIDKLLVEDLAESGLIVAITDENGRLLWVEGDSAAKDRAVRMNFAEGADWSERSAGTNAPGTALAVDHGVQIFEAEHFSRAVHEWSCSAAPVHNPNTGQILGAIDITGGPRVAVPEVLALIRATVATVESELRFHLLERPHLFDSETPRVEFLCTATPTIIRGGQPSPLQRRHAEILLLLGAHPEGLSAEQLAVLLDEHELDAVTIRAEVSRLRKVYGAEGLSSRPYRLRAPVNSDVRDVCDALDRGDLERAIGLYRGPVLPASDAPGVVRIRADLREQMRAAMLRAGDPGQLGRWLATPEGREDSELWAVYRAALDPGSTAFARASARIAVLDRELGS
ncbi:transcriptional regulator [Aldersonia sp. NBC_00410]|uniref:transcriptional regulator n=1 Tax=Aldersonia sp. NBC_00410 TaxID=2975954 RepID=UPI0022558967|nr:transcriptional regulator [Aldersonia sp. NBC_00410]MCX5041588.1 transcriptional regulator [Aldersonia sp. NBC_00410]